MAGFPHVPPPPPPQPPGTPPPPPSPPPTRYAAVTWGEAGFSDSRPLTFEYDDVIEVVANTFAFAAIRQDRTRTLTRTQTRTQTLTPGAQDSQGRRAVHKGELHGQGRHHLTMAQTIARTIT